MKKIVTTIIALFIVIAGIAQENNNRNASNKVVRGPYETNNGFFDNFYIQGGAGAAIYLGGQNADFSKRIVPMYEIGIGKWITPTIGVRLLGNYSPYMRQYSTKYSSPFNVSNTLQKFSFINVHADFMWNISNALGGYKESRVYEIIPYVGFGWAHIEGTTNKKNNNEISTNVGILNKFRVSRTVDINLDLHSAILHGNADGSTINNKIDIPVGASLGITVRLGKVKSFKRVQAPITPDYTPYEKQINELESAKKVLIENNAALASEIEKLRSKPADVVIEKASSEAAPVALFFGLGKTTLDKKELTNLDFFVNNAMKNDKNKVFTLIGSADSATGSAAVNQRISEQRMQYVYNLLVNKYGISPSKLLKKAEGASNNRFSDPELNRTVIIE